jgi:hypothetical protein
MRAWNAHGVRHGSIADECWPAYMAQFDVW